MNHRYVVYDTITDKPIALIVAATPVEAVQKACSATTGHDPANCIAKRIEIKLGTKAIGGEMVDRHK